MIKALLFLLFANIDLCGLQVAMSSDTEVLPPQKSATWEQMRYGDATWHSSVKHDSRDVLPWTIFTNPISNSYDDKKGDYEMVSYNRGLARFPDRLVITDNLILRRDYSQSDVSIGTLTGLNAVIDIIFGNIDELTIHSNIISRHLPPVLNLQDTVRTKIASNYIDVESYSINMNPSAVYHNGILGGFVGLSGKEQSPNQSTKTKGREKRNQECPIRHTLLSKKIGLCDIKAIRIIGMILISIGGGSVAYCVTCINDVSGHRTLTGRPVSSPYPPSDVCVLLTVGFLVLIFGVML